MAARPTVSRWMVAPAAAISGPPWPSTSRVGSICRSARTSWAACLSPLTSATVMNTRRGRLEMVGWSVVIRLLHDLESPLLRLVVNGRRFQPRHQGLDDQERRQICRAAHQENRQVIVAGEREDPAGGGHEEGRADVPEGAAEPRDRADG